MSLHFPSSLQEKGLIPRNALMGLTALFSPANLSNNGQAVSLQANYLER